jgi:hypothetical protein
LEEVVDLLPDGKSMILRKRFRVVVAGVLIFVLAAGLTRLRPTQRAEANDKGLRR